MNLKMQAAAAALEYVQDGMALGLGSGSTSACFVDLLGQRFQTGTLNHICAVPTSESTAARARALGIPVTSLGELSKTRQPLQLDLAVDGADEVDPALNLIKGLGRALLREKMVEQYARVFVVIVDESKIVSRLGSRGPLPVEMVPFESVISLRWLESLGCRAELSKELDGGPVVTDNGNYLAHCWFDGGIPDAFALARQLADRPGIVEHGLFLEMAQRVVVAAQGGIRILERA